MSRLWGLPTGLTTMAPNSPFAVLSFRFVGRWLPDGGL